MRIPSRCLFFASLIVLSVVATAADLPRAGVTSDGRGAVATVNPLATQVALTVMEQGGTAVDAAVAAAFVLGVVDGHNSGIGGGSFALVHWADGTVEAVDAREMAPGAAKPDMFIRDGKPDPSLSRTGPLAVGIPGSVASFEYLVKKGGKRSLQQLVEPAAELAEKGFAMDFIFAGRLASAARSLQNFPGSAAVFLDANGKPWPEGHRLIQTDLAKTYRAIGKQGADYYYKGEFAKAVGSWMQQNAGIITAADFANYQLKVREPVKTNYRQFTVYGFPPPSSGGVHVAQIMNMVEQFDLAKMSAADRYHVLAEAMKIAFADRAHWLGDPDFVDVPRGLIDKGYAKSLAANIALDKTNKVAKHGEPPAGDTDIFGKHTTHIATADKDGNWVAITTTVNTGFGSKIVVPGTGVILNNQMDDFSAKPGSPNAYRLVGAEANSVQPGKRPLSSMSPTIVLKDGKPIFSTGAAGGPTIITQVVQTTINYLDLNMSVRDALAAPRVHHQWSPDRLMVETALDETIKAELRKRGQDVMDRGFLGTSQAIALEKGVFSSSAEPRLEQRAVPQY